MVVKFLLSTLVVCLVVGFTSSALPDNVCKSSSLSNGKLQPVHTVTSNSHGLQNREWCGTKGTSNWVEFDFGSAVGIRAVTFVKSTQENYVKSFSIQYIGIQGNVLQNYGQNPNHAMVINALNQKLTSATVSLTGVVVTKIKINIVDFNQQPCIKLDLLGCTNPNELCPSPCQNGGMCVFEETCACPAGYEGKQCQSPVSHSHECSTRLGMADNKITDSSLSVSSSRTGHGKEKARYGCCTNENGGAWCPADSDRSPWYEVNFDKPQSVGGFDFLQPSHPANVVPSEYLKTFELQYWLALDTHKAWRTFSKDIPAVYNDTLYYTIQLTPPIVAKAVRLIPETYKKAPCIRFDVLGCDPKVLCPTDYCKNGGSCMGQNVCQCRSGYYGNQCEHTANQLITLNAGFQTIIHQVLQTTTTIKFTVHGNPQLVPGQTGQAVHITNSNQYLIVDKSGFTSCLSDIDHCTGGFTITTNVKFSTLTDNTYIISSGGNLPNTKGIALYYQGGKIHFVVSTSTQTWHLTIPHAFTLNVWHHIELSWQKNLGSELIDNGKLVGSVTQPVNKHATVVRQIAIGHGYTQSTTHISMKVEGLKTVDANRVSLAVAGIVTALPTTTVTTTPTPTPTTVVTTPHSTVTTTPTPTPTTVVTTPHSTAFVCGDKQVNFDFMEIKDNILVTPNYNFTVYKNPFIRKEANGKTVLVLNTTGQYVELPNKGIECIQDMTKCDSGFTLSLDIKWLNMNSTNKLYIFSSGGDKVNNSGIALYLWHGELYCSAKKDKVIWTAKQKLGVKSGEWHSFQVSWNKQNGFIVYLDGHFFMKNSIKLPNPAQNGVHPLLIATTPGHNDTSLMEVRNLYTWTASRDILINHTCITEFPTVEPTTSPTTTTTMATTTKKQETPKYEWNFVKIPHSQTVVGTKFNATLHGKFNVNSTGINFNNNQQYIDLGIHKDLCFSNLSLCNCGLTIKITIMFTQLEENTVIISSGAEKSNGTGIAMVYRYGQVHCVVSTSTDTWFAVIQREKLAFHHFHQVIISWSPTHGLKVIVDSHVISTVTTSIKHQPITSSMEHMYIGNPPLGASSSSCNYFMSSVIIWHCWIDSITPPVPETTTSPPKTHPPATTQRPPSTTDHCKNGYVCKDDLSTHPTWMPTKPVTTLKQTSPSKKPTDKPKPKTTRPTKATTPKATKPTRPRTTRPTKATTPKATRPTRPTKPTRPKTTRPTKPTKPTTPKPTPKPTTPKPTTPRPSRPSYTAIPHLTPGVSGTGMAYFSCQFEKSKQPNVEFIVCLHINLKCVKQVLVSGTYQEVKYTIEEINQNLFKKQISCSVKARFKGQNLVTVIKTSNIITPDIKLVTGTKILIEGHSVQHLVVNVTAPPQMFCCQGCKGSCQVTITTHSNYERFYQRCSHNKYISEVMVGWAGTSQSPTPNICGTSVAKTTHVSSWQQTIKIPVKATVDGRIDRNTHNGFTVQAHVVNKPKPPITAIPHTITVGQVQIQAHNNDHSGQCASLNDPHITTFDGRHYDNHNGGEFIMYKHTSLPYEVRGYYTKCTSRSRVYCNCGAAIKSGDDVITFKTCGSSGNSGHDHGHGHGGFLGFLFHGHRHHSRHRSPARIAVDLYKNGELTPGTQILRIGCGQKYQVILPTGTVVTVQSSGSSFINIWIKPSSVDRGNTEGLCGTYDGNRYNDVLGPHGRPDNNKRPQFFCMKWKAPQSIFYGVSAAAFNYINTFCSCINGKEVFCNRGHGVAYCKPSRYDITRTILSQAKIPHISHRGRRSLLEDDTVPLTTAVAEIESNVTFTMGEAKDKCKEMVKESKAVKTCWATVNETDFETKLDNCAADLNATGDEAWAAGYITDVVEACLNTMHSQAEIVNGTIIPSSNRAPVNTSELCQEDCGQNGECVEGVCKCAPGFSGLVCDVSAEDTVPDIVTQSGGGNCGCDRRTTADCNTITVFGDGFVESGTLTCFYEFTKTPMFGKPASLTRSVLADYVSINQVTCTLPEVRDGVYVSISNNGQDFSTDWYLHTVYDSKCYDCKETGKASPPVQYVKKEYTCLINGECYGVNDKKVDDACKVCDPSNSKNKWTESGDKTCKCSSETEVKKVKSDKEDSSKQTVTILAVVIGILSFVMLVSLVYNCKMRFKKPSKKGSEYSVSEPPKSYSNAGYSLEPNEKM